MEQQQQKDSNVANFVIVVIFIIAVIILGYLHYSGYFKTGLTNEEQNETEKKGNEQTR